jgi:hypothetical protein
MTKGKTPAAFSLNKINILCDVLQHLRFISSNLTSRSFKTALGQ